MKRILAIGALVFALPFLPGAQAAGAKWTLITPEEDARDTAAPHVPQPTQPAVPGAPVIEVRQPDISQLIHNPVTFDVRFSAAPGATIDLPTFRANMAGLGSTSPGGCWSTPPRLLAACPRRTSIALRRSYDQSLYRRQRRPNRLASPASVNREVRDRRPPRRRVLRRRVSQSWPSVRLLTSPSRVPSANGDRRFKRPIPPEPERQGHDARYE